MQAPKCRLCGERHWASEPCDFGGVGNAEPEVTAPVTAKSSDKPPFDRKRYQRDYLRRYMRSYLPKWRAKRARKLQEN